MTVSEFMFFDSFGEIYQTWVNELKV